MLIFTKLFSFLFFFKFFSLNHRDLQPNIGLFWYFFTEMFEHFRPLFLFSFQMNATVLYLVPLTIKLHKQPIFLATILIALTSIFRSYPCIGDIAFYMALFPLWKHSTIRKLFFFWLAAQSTLCSKKNLNISFQWWPTILLCFAFSSSHRHSDQPSGICGFIVIQPMRISILVQH